jgi:hypothetical protein
MSKARSGGGITSNKLVQSRAPKAEPKAHAMSPGGVSRIGVHPSPLSRPEPIEAGRGFQPVGPTDNVAAVGVGGGRTVHRTGSQSPTPAAKAMPAGRDILSEFGPERSKG